jgi:hypothetical protein
MRPAPSPPKSEVPLKIVGGCTFGRNHKISSERTYNMFVSDDTLIQTPGYRVVITPKIGGKGRGIFASSRGGFMVTVIDNVVSRVQGPEGALEETTLFELGTYFGDVTIEENSNYQIAICDGLDLWIYNWKTGVHGKATLPDSEITGQDIIPGYVTYHDGYFIVPDTSTNQWFISKPNDGLVWDWGAGSTSVNGAIQTKPDFAEAVLRAPGKGSLIYVFGQNVTELFNDIGAQLFPYQRQSSVSIDYGCISSNTIATMDEYVAFLGVNEKAGPAILVSAGGPFERISNDGIDFKLAEVVAPQSSTAFFYKLGGHVFYQITFFDPRDNFSLLYDFNTKDFFYVTDENMNYSIIHSVAFYNNVYYFVSLNDGNIYEFDILLTQYDYTPPGAIPMSQAKMIPCIRICNTAEQADSSQFIANSLSFIMEQGMDPYWKSMPQRYITTEGGQVITTEAEPTYVGVFLQTELVLPDYAPRIDLSISKDAGVTFGSFYGKELNTLGNRKNRVVFWGLGISNSFTVQLRFWSKFRKTISNGVISARERETL